MSRLADILQARTGCADCAAADAAHFGATGNGVSDKPWDGAASRFDDAEYKRACAACDPGDGTVKERCFLPHHEPDGTTNRNGVHAAAQRVSSLKGHDAGAVARAKAHLRSHYRELKEDPPDSLQGSGHHAEMTDEEHAAWHAAEEALAHAATSGRHSHPHPAYGSQGGDATHEHEHSHDGDASHDHEHGMTAGAVSFRRAHDGQWTLTAGGADPLLGARWGIVQDGAGFHVLTAGGRPWNDTTVADYAAALAVIAEQLAAEADTRPVLAEPWRSDMAFEGRSTGDGRKIMPGATSFRPVPLPLMLQTETEGGHIGAVLAGSILTAAMSGQTAAGTGNFDASDAGRQALQILQARGRFGVSIDVAEADGYPVCQTHGENLDGCDFGCPIEACFTTLRVMGLTMTPFPAFEDAYIELASAAASPAATGAGADPGALALAVDNILDAACPLAAAIPFGQVTDPHAQTGLALTIAAGVMSDELLEVMGVDDPDGTSAGGAAADAATQVAAAEALDAAIVAARNAFEAAHLADDDPCAEVFAMIRRADDASGNVLAALGAPDPDVEEGTDPNRPGTTASAATSGTITLLDPALTLPAQMQMHVHLAVEDTAITAAGGRYPPAAWFADPRFGADPTVDGRLFRQPDGQTLCPLTVEPPDPAHGGLRRVYGHLAGWKSCHTSYQNRCVVPPRSRTGYAAINLRPVMTAEGDPVNVGHLTMGCGHANPTGLSVADVRQHYDGGPGAVTMAYVRYGEDGHGPWFAGYVNPAATDAQVEAFAACSVSGDWREVWRGRGLELVACLAGVKVPGFNITRALAAAGVALPAGEPLPDVPLDTWVDGRLTALVAAGTVRQPYPWERPLGALTAALEAAQGRLRVAEADLAVLRPLVAERLAAGITSTPE